KLLQDAPEVWAEYDRNKMTKSQEDAAAQLVRAGMVEWRSSSRIRLIGSKVEVHATITHTGEYGLLKAFTTLLPCLRDLWKEDGKKWMAGPQTHPMQPPMQPQTQREGPEYWRLTPYGVMAKNHLNANLPAYLVVGTVLQRKLFAGLGPEPCDGNLENLDVVCAAAPWTGPVDVNLINHDAVGKSLADAINGEVAAAMQANGVTPQPSSPKKKPSGNKPELQSWTQGDLDNAIRKYQADRASAYTDIRDAVVKGKKGAKKAAQELFGRNAIARALNVKSPPMVSKSPAWVAIAVDLGLSLKRGKAHGTRHTKRTGKVGHDKAIEDKSATPEAGGDNAPAEAKLEIAEQQETLRQIDELAKTGKTAKKKAENKKAAAELKTKYENGEITDDQARQVVKMALNKNAIKPND
ncbi:MAG: hypothetical protein FWD53_12485, partial [Phycisphaerales bacterium]|nr:hypothetical protein [Phycisphaerales bacterium]